MREILFRGKRLDNGEWEFGDLYHRGEEVVITSFYTKRHVAVDPKTVGQFTGHEDEKGKPIFEGDVLLVIRGRTKYVCAIKDIRQLPDAMFGSSVKSIEIVSDIWDPFWQKGGGQP